MALKALLLRKKIDDKKKRDAIEEHCKEELESYIYEYSSHKTERH